MTTVPAPGDRKGRPYGEAEGDPYGEAEVAGTCVPFCLPLEGKVSRSDG